MLRRPILAFALGTAVFCGCGASVYRMPERAIVWNDPDRQPFSPRPRDRYVSWRFDALDHLLLRPISHVWRFETDREAINVNALDEVPDSSFFENRIGRFGMSPAEVARGACDAVEVDAPFPWTVVGGKPDGTNPGFTIEDANGTKYLLKTDGTLQPERGTAADAIAAALYHAVGYNVPCNRIVFFSRDDLEIAPDARAERTTGEESPLTEEHVEVVLAAAARTPDGRYRAALSRFIEGDPIGPWSYEGMLASDPNDVVPHTMRRDLRGLYVMAAWTGHIDSRQENTLASFVDAGNDRGYIRHYLIDFGDCFGVLHPNDRLARGFEHEHYIDFGTIFVDYVSAGLIVRPWQEARFGRAGRTLGYYDSHRFVPDAWAAGYPNPAFEAHTEHDAAWMARILARFSRAHLRAVVALGRFSQPSVQAELERILASRRQRILARYLTRISPLAWPAIDGTQLCLEDLAVTSGLRRARHRSYDAWIADSEPRQDRALLYVSSRVGSGRVCVRLPAGLRYAAVDVVASNADAERTFPARAHVYRAPSGAYRVVGLERLGSEHR